MKERLNIDNSESLPLTIDAIRIGDWIKSKLCGVVVGRVERLGYLGKHGIPIFIVRLANGREEIIAKDDTEILGYLTL